jgi:hypothetical protein
MDIVGMIFRWVHVASVAVLIGGTFYASFIAKSVAASFRPVVWTTIAAILGSGVYNLLTKESLPSGYHMVFGIKMLLVLHIFAVGLMATTPAFEDAKRVRMMKGTAISGLVVILLSAYLRATGLV